MKHKSKQPKGQRQLKVGEELRHVISTTLQRGGFDDPALIDSGLITVTEARIAPDLKNATVFVMPLGGYNLKAIVEALNDQSFYFQREIARQMKMKFTPRLTFKADESFGEAVKIERIIKQIHGENE
ncbi:MAG: 30S ribosome-binding factor RbfA [Proteobacteria bacterium]|nr:30S ribosome-binding factor RbfA [Pseudomonadota bacterium]